MTTVSQLESEIFQQPDLLARLLREERQTVMRIVETIRQRAPRFVVLVARGSSDNAARYGQYVFGAINGWSVALATPSLFTLYGKPPNMADALVIAISQSGQSPDIVSVIASGREQGALTIAVTNEPESPLANAAEYCLNLHAGQEFSVAATKTYTTSLMSLAMLSAALTGDSDRFAALETVPSWIEQILATADATLKSAERYRYMDACVVLSRGYNYATAFEIALKLKELTYVLAEPYSSADFKHGPVALVESGFPVLAVIPEGVVENELVEFTDRLKGRGAELIVASASARALAGAATPLPIPKGVPEWVSPLVSVVPGQLFALGLTLAKGYDPDNPRGIRKVTLTQ